MVSIRGMGTNAQAYSCEWVGTFSEKVALYCGRMTVNSPFGIWRDHIKNDGAWLMPDAPYFCFQDERSMGSC